LNFNSYDKQQEFYNKSEKIILSKIRNKFDTNFREKTFVKSLSELIKSYCDLAKITGAGLMYQYISNVNSFWNTEFIEPLRDVIYRTPSHKIHSENKYSLFHYDLPQENNYRQKKDEDEIVKKGISGTNITSNRYATPVSIPLLIIYAFINRNYILDLLPNPSIVRNFQK
jgi:poly[(R)-3-hydroxyalkanoate] polymerase subunit PhaC